MSKQTSTTDVDTAFEEFGKAMGNFAFRVSAQCAIANVLSGNEKVVESALEGMSADRLEQLLGASRKLTTMVLDEIGIR